MPARRAPATLRAVSGDDHPHPIASFGEFGSTQDLVVPARRTDEMSAARAQWHS